MCTVTRIFRSRHHVWVTFVTLKVVVVPDRLVAAEGGELVAGGHLGQGRRSLLGEIDQSGIDRC